MKILVKDIHFEKAYKDWDEPVKSANEIFEKEPHNTLKLLAPFHVHAEYFRVGHNIDIRGTYTGDLEFDCHRCCERSVMHFDEKFHFILQPGKEKKEEENIEEGDEELEFGYYDGEEIDLSELAIEHFMLSLPFKMLCKDDCKGICPYCGANKNQTECDCKQKLKKGTPFAILKNKE